MYESAGAGFSGGGGFPIQISIDGPAGAGKSTVARALAEALGFIHIDTGAMYRAIAWLALERGVNLQDEGVLGRPAQTASIYFSHQETPEAHTTSGSAGAMVIAGATQRVYCEGQDITDAIRSRRVSEAVSQVAAFPEVREALVKTQRLLAENQNVVMDGRDIGTVVLPFADCKIFLTASVQERAKRRMRERRAAEGEVSLDDVAREIQQRDEEDMKRQYSPLVQAQDSILLNTTDLSLPEAVQAALRIARSAR